MILPPSQLDHPDVSQFMQSDDNAGYAAAAALRGNGNGRRGLGTMLMLGERLEAPEEVLSLEETTGLDLDGKLAGLSGSLRLVTEPREGKEAEVKEGKREMLQLPEGIQENCSQIVWEAGCGGGAIFNVKSELARKAPKRRATELKLAGPSGGHVVFHNPSVKCVHYTVTTDTGSTTKISSVGKLVLPPTSFQAPQKNVPPEKEPDTEGTQEKKRTQKGQLLDDFGGSFEELGSLLLECEVDSDVDLFCSCGSKEQHTTKGLESLIRFFLRHDISVLGHVIHLGHNGSACPSAVGERLFTVVDGNGIHSTHLAFCGCKELPPNKNRQLVRTGLFLATAKDAHTAFTIKMLKEFQLHNFESKKAAYNYLGAIRRLTDNSFTADVAKPYAAFLRVVRVFNYLTLVKRSGQLHGIDTLLPHRLRGNLLVWCPGCPEPGFNSDPNCPETLFSKNTDPDDVSLCAGKAYFPLESAYQEYLQSVPTSTEPCVYPVLFRPSARQTVYLTASNRLFYFLTLTIRFVNSNYALAMALKNHNPSKEFMFKLQIEVNDVDKVSTYDIACQYIIYLEDRFKNNSLTSWNMSRKCGGVCRLFMYRAIKTLAHLFGTVYMECIGHFHGETAEHYWPEANQLGPHVRQMNLGHRQDTMIQHHGDWNHKKTLQLVSDLSEGIVEAKQKYKMKRDHFIALSLSFSDRVPEWREIPRITSKQGKDAATIYDKMISDDNNFTTTLDRGLKIQDSQRKLKHLIHDTEEHELQAWKKEISKRTTKLRDQMAVFRRDQKHFMPKLGDKVAAQTACGLAIELEQLYLPSDLTKLERQQLDLVPLGAEESKWREGQIFDILRALQNIVKGLGTLRFQKYKNDCQQKQNSWPGDHIAEAIKHQNQHRESYGVVRMALIALNGSTTFPVLPEVDLFMKPVQHKRRVGDSKRTDGLLWRAKALAMVGLYDEGDRGTQSESESEEPECPKRSKRDPKVSQEPQNEKHEGRIGQLDKLTKMSSSEMDAWSNEGDRVQWFRAEAEMQRWQEQWEQKLAELLRTIRSFSRMQLVWAQLADTQPADRPGASAYAHQKAAMYARRAKEGRESIKKLGYGDLIKEKANLVLFVETERQKEAALVKAALSNS
ncbi:hypothetical protein C8F04DRAFT_1194153 [Mycena alexandri]|uniref:CxC2-like cysteine cluster KDZ transposase-associated domain-containing protein n=1 Tax=Mycena alexandri TaxID=1745969 RepID=A0AAD6S8F6_9AGAR|nr:hypothetical protein C8F04DRAFT_1194153 [Mycena alexandri]